MTLDFDFFRLMRGCLQDAYAAAATPLSEGESFAEAFQVRLVTFTNDW